MHELNMCMLSGCLDLVHPFSVCKNYVGTTAVHGAGCDCRVVVAAVYPAEAIVVLLDVSNSMMLDAYPEEETVVCAALLMYFHLCFGMLGVWYMVLLQSKAVLFNCLRPVSTTLFTVVCVRRVLQVLPAPGHIRVRCASLLSHFVAEVPAAYTISEFAEWLEENQGIPYETELMYAGQLLEDERTLASYDIGRFPGGCVALHGSLIALLASQGVLNEFVAVIVLCTRCCHDCQCIHVLQYSVILIKASRRLRICHVLML